MLSLRIGTLSGVLYEYMTPNVAAMAVAVFVLFRYLLGVSDEGSRRQSLSGLAKITFGVYLVHDLFLMAYRHLGIAQLPLPPVLAVPVVTALVLIPSAAVAWLISKIPFAGRYLT